MAYQLKVNRKAEIDVEEAIGWYEAQSIGLGIEFCWNSSRLQIP